MADKRPEASSNIKVPLRPMRKARKPAISSQKIEAAGTPDPADGIAPVPMASAPEPAPVAISAPTVATPPASVGAVIETPFATAKKVIEAVASPAEEIDVPAIPATLAPIKEGLAEMATVTTPQEATDKAQAMFGDMNTRFKSAFEKSSKLSEEMVEFSKGNVEAIVASARIAAKAGEAIGQEAADYSKKSFESAMAVFKSLASVKSPTELLQLQSDYAKSSFDSAVAEASKLSESMLKIAGEIAQPLSSRYALAAEKIKSAAV